MYFLIINPPSSIQLLQDHATTITPTWETACWKVIKTNGVPFQLQLSDIFKWKIARKPLEDVNWTPVIFHRLVWFVMLQTDQVHISGHSNIPFLRIRSEALHSTVVKHLNLFTFILWLTSPYFYPKNLLFLLANHQMNIHKCTYWKMGGGGKHQGVVVVFETGKRNFVIVKLVVFQGQKTG